MEETLAAMRRYNVVLAVVAGSLEQLEKWEAAAPGRIMPAEFFDQDANISLDSVRALFRTRKLAVLAEVATQYAGLSPSDTFLEPYFALAEELDIPVGIHMGPGPAGTAYFLPMGRKYRATLSNPLLLEDVLLRHPRLRIYVMHAGWPMLDEMIHLLYSHPQVYADLGVIDWLIPRKEFHFYLRRLVDAGFGKRLMFGTDQIIWPQALGIAVESIETADFLTEEERRDIFCNNAAHFFRLANMCG